MAIDANSQVNRRGFLKGAAAGAAGAAAATVSGIAATDAEAQLPDQARVAFTPGAGRTDAGARDGAPPGRARRDDRRRPGLRLHGRCAQEARLRVHRRQPGIELQRPSRIVHQLRRQHRAGVDHVLPRAGVGEHRERLLRGGRQADGRDHVRAIRSASRDDGHLRCLLSTYANLPSRREHPRRQRAATRVRLGPAFRGRSGWLRSATW